MAINFRLNYNNGVEYADLFFKTSLENIIEIGNCLHYSTLQLEIPSVAANTITQTIPITISSSQENCAVAMFLLDDTTQAQSDYATISQFEIQNNQLIITRLYNWPTDSVNVLLLFKEGGMITNAN